MPRRRLAALAAAVLVAVAACAEDPSDVDARDLVGLWGAVSMVYTSQADPATQADLVEAGFLYSMQLHADGTYETSLFGHSAPTEVESGTFQVRNRQLLLSPSDGSTRTLDLTFNNALLTLTEAEAAWDFDGDGTADPATLHLVLDRS